MKRRDAVKLLGLAAVFFLFLPFFCGCKSKSADPIRPGAETENGEMTEELTVWTLTGNPNDLNHLPGVLEMEERTGIPVHFTAVPTSDDLATEFSLLLAKGEMPDIVYLSLTDGYPGGMERAIENGVFLDTTELVLNWMPHYRKMMESNEEISKGVRSESGRILLYSISGDDDGPRQEGEWMGLAVRKDWLDALRLPVPETLSDWEIALSAFRDQMGAEAPLLLKSKGYFSGGAFLSAFGILPRFYVENDVVKYGPAEPGYREYLEVMAEWYDRGLIDANFVTNGTDLTAPDELFENGVAGAGETLWTKTQDYYEGMRLAAVPNPVRTRGEIPYGEKIKDGLVNSLIGISASCKNPELAARWLDYQYSKEGMELNFYGIEGKSYDVMPDGSYDLNREVLQDPDGAEAALARFARGNGLGWYNWEILEKLGPQRLRMVESKQIWSGNNFSKCLPYLLDQEGSADNECYRIVSALEALAAEKTVNYIMKRESLDTYGEFQDLLMQYGLADALDYYQTAYEVYGDR